MDKTLEYYNTNAENYYENTLTVNLNHLYRDFLEYIPKEGTILDLGCGCGRDSLFFKDHGYLVTSLDGSSELARKASQLLNQEVIVMNFEDINIKEDFNGIWACASLLHVKKENLLEVLNNLVNHNLKENGVFYMSFKYGDCQYTDANERYFNCYTENTFTKLIEQVKGLSIDKVFKTEDVIPGRDNLIWLNTICIKR